MLSFLYKQENRWSQYTRPVRSLPIHSTRSLVSISSIYFFLFCFIFLIACSSSQKVKLKQDSKGQLEYYSELYTGQDNLPYFKKPLVKRPSAPNTTYYAVSRQRESEQITAAFQIVIPPTKKSKNSLKVIWKETQSGFKGGVKFWETIPSPGLSVNSSKETIAAIIVISIPVAIGTVTGFITGIGSATKNELTKAFDKRSEVLISTYKYRYDAKGRLEYQTLRTYDGKKYRILETIQHFYKSSEKRPYKTKIQNKVSRKTRILKSI